MVSALPDQIVNGGPKDIIFETPLFRSGQRGSWKSGPFGFFIQGMLDCVHG